jgi:hypothetical protein
MATVINPESGRVQASFSAVAKHYGVAVRPCPPRRGNRKGVVEKANHVAAQRFWRTLPDDVTVEEAQTRLERWCATRGDVRLRATADGTASVATVAATEPLRPAPADPFPVRTPRFDPAGTSGLPEPAAPAATTPEAGRPPPCCPSSLKWSSVAR